MDKQNYCEGCRHFEHKWKGWGRCKRYPKSVWKKREDGCGEHEPLKERGK